ncbi:MAG: hypothetical protein ACSLEX_00615 [Minisyncoccota bacterium]
MWNVSALSFSEKNTRISFLIFCTLLLLSVACFAFADENISGKNIFQDSDQDGLSNDEEKLYGTDSFVKDTDGDGYSDGVEVGSGYDPLKPAPGDKVTTSVPLENVRTVTNGSENLTQQVSDEIVHILKNTDTNNQEVSLDAVNASVQKVLNAQATDVVLPEVDIKSIKIKKLSKHLKDKDRKEQERSYTIEYLTVISYIMANNSPNTFQDESGLDSVLTTISNESISALLSGDFNYIEQLSERGKKILEELQDVEVPENMLDMHVKALQMTQYLIQIKDELQSVENDPLRQISVLAKMQGLLSSTGIFIQEVHKRFVDYGIEQIPLNL